MKHLMKFEADWCGPCHAIRPLVEKIADENELDIVVVDIDKDSDVATLYGVASIPTIILIEDGSEVARHIGSAPKSTIEKNLNL